MCMNHNTEIQIDGENIQIAKTLVKKDQTENNQNY